MFKMKLGSDDFFNDSEFVKIGSVVKAIVGILLSSSSPDRFQAERDAWPHIHTGIAAGKLHPLDPETLDVLSIDHYGNGVVSFSELVEWGLWSHRFDFVMEDFQAKTTPPNPLTDAQSIEHYQTPVPAPATDTATPAPVVALSDETQSNEGIRYEVLASRTELIQVFSLYGVEPKIFKALKDRPGLKAACRVKGKGQKGSRAEPMFCPFEVINWLVKTGVKEKPRLTNTMGWHILETKFQSVYAEKSIGDPRQN